MTKAEYKRLPEKIKNAFQSDTNEKKLTPKAFLAWAYNHLDNEQDQRPADLDEDQKAFYAQLRQILEGNF